MCPDCMFGSLIPRQISPTANRFVEFLLYPIDRLSGEKYIEAEERAVAIEVRPHSILIVRKVTRTPTPNQKSIIS